MRLSLRTLLAFEDNLFDIEQQRQLERIIPGHDTASETIGRIREAVRNPFLGVPGAVDGQEELDPNLVAAYLDHRMPEKLQSRFEQHCLASDKYLAEIASVHQIVSNVLGEPARTSRECRLRCYELYHFDDETEEADFRPGKPEPPAERNLAARVSQKDVQPPSASPGVPATDVERPDLSQIFKTTVSGWVMFWRRLFFLLLLLILVMLFGRYHSTPFISPEESVDPVSDSADIAREATASESRFGNPTETVVVQKPEVPPEPSPEVRTPPVALAEHKPVSESPGPPTPSRQPVVQVSDIQAVSHTASPADTESRENAAAPWNMTVPETVATAEIPADVPQNPPNTLKTVVSANGPEASAPEPDAPFSAGLPHPAADSPFTVSVAVPETPSSNAAGETPTASSDLVADRPIVQENPDGAPDKPNPLRDETGIAQDPWTSHGLAWPSHFESSSSDAVVLREADSSKDANSEPTNRSASMQAASSEPAEPAWTDTRLRAPVPPPLARSALFDDPTPKPPKIPETVFATVESPAQSRIEFQSPRRNETLRRQTAKTGQAPDSTAFSRRRVHAPGDLPASILPAGGGVEKSASSSAVLGGVLRSDESDIVFSAASASAPWRMEPRPFELFADQYILTVAPFRTVLEIGNSFRVEMVGDVKLCILPPDEHGVPGIFIDYGRLLVRRCHDNGLGPASPNPAASLRIETEKSRGVLQMQGVRSLAFVDMFAEIVDTPSGETKEPTGHRNTDDLASSAKPNPILGLIPSASETVLWTAEGTGRPLIAERETGIPLSGNRFDRGSNLLHAPHWLQPEPLSAEWRSLAAEGRRIFERHEGDCESALKQLIREESVALRSLGFRLWGDLGRFDIPLTYFSMAGSAEEPVRQILVAYFREVMKRDGETVQRLADAIDSVRR